MEAQSISIAMSDSSAGYEVTPARVRLAALADFTRDVTDFLAGEDREIDVNSLDVAVVPGSVAIQTAPIVHAPSLIRDLSNLLTSPLLDALDSKRRKVVERWQRGSRKQPGLSFRIAAPFLDSPVVVSSRTDFRADDADQWVRVERYVRGEIMDLGGVGKANAHVKLPDGRTLTVSTTRDILAADKVNRLYKPAMLRIRAQFNVLTQELRGAELIEFVEYAPRFDAQAFERQTRRGAERWKDVPDATAWVEDFRGGDA
ncbi:MAG: hypothetical protein AB9M53_04680 [Leptothrix sp. (in: b-proteobacteria)]